jgi:quercetin dioxygenase-like cupin family protein
MIVREIDAKKREFLGVSFDIFAIGKKSMITRMNYRAGDQVPFHSHRSEQSGYIVSGKIRIIFDEHDEILQSGDSYSILSETVHCIYSIEDSIVLDFFSPPRKDYL